MRPNAQLRNAAKLRKEAEERYLSATKLLGELHTREEVIRARYAAIAQYEDKIYQRENELMEDVHENNKTYLRLIWFGIGLGVWSIFLLFFTFVR